MSPPVALIPAAGVGARLRPHTLTVPAALIRVAGRPVVGHIIDGLIAEGITRIIVIVGHMGERIREDLSRRYGSAVEFVEQSERLGAAHALYVARDRVGDDPCLVIFGDTIVQTDLSDLHGTKEIVVGVAHVSDPRLFGIVEAEGDRVRALHEKPTSGVGDLAMVGLYYFPEPILLFDVIGRMIVNGRMTDGEYQLTDALKDLCNAGAPMQVLRVESWFDCGKPETLLMTNRHLLDLLPSSPTLPGVVVVHPVSIDPSSIVKQSIVGPYVSIAPDVEVVNTIVRDSIVSEGARISNMLLDRSVIGEHAAVQGSFETLSVGDSSAVNLSGAPEGS